ncbi:MAG: RIP metalloprotease RseP [Azoarcus sp.]|jgi:regulator of sigma E protease|nr:RIP metalloprotease RseP [Azoarcus sp.]
MSFILDYVIPFVIGLGLLILVHELGHYLVARACGVKVLRFSIGFGKPLFKRRAGKDDTEWVLAAIPLGGYVKMLGEGDDADEVPESEAHRAFSRQPVGKRFAIVAAGPIFNILLAVLLYWGLFIGGTEELRPYVAPTEAAESPARAGGVRDGDLVVSIDGDEVKSWQDLRWALLRHAIDRDEARLTVTTAAGDTAVRTLDLTDFSLDDTSKEDPINRMGLRPQPPQVPAVVDSVQEGGAAARAGLKKGDEILAIDDKPVAASRDVIEIVHRSAGQALAFVVRRDGERLNLTVTPEERQLKDGAAAGFIGTGFDVSAMFATVRYGPVEALARAARFTWEMSALSLKSIGQLIVGNISLKNVSGPITIADFAGKSAQLGLASFVRFLAFISISLGILNLLPVPVLDGGHLLYYAVEFVRGSALPERVLEIGQKIGLTFLLMLMAFALYNDINRLIS